MSVAAQTTFHNDGNVVHLSSGAIVYVEGGVNNHNDGLLTNAGTFHFSDDWSSNTAASDDVDALPGAFVFAGVQQRVFAAGDVQFPSVRLAPSVVRVRQIASDATVGGTLELHDGEWATGSNTLTVTNVEPLAITREAGYVSTDTIGAYLVRHMDRFADYLFPLGSSGDAVRNPTARYRPVVIAPAEAGDVVAEEFAVRFGNLDPTDDDTDGGAGFDRAQRDPTLTRINDQFYYMVEHPVGGQSGDLKFYYDQDDGRYSTVAQVQDDDVWRDMFGSVEENVVRPYGTEALDRVATLQRHRDFTKPVFTEAGADTDNDGVADRLDLDADNDGIANVDESPSDPYGDADGDGYFDYLDADFAGCGGIRANVCVNFDADRDGFANHLDLDADGDGIYDIIEAGGLDADFDAQVEYPIPGVASSMIDLDHDGFADARDHLDGMRADDPGEEVTSGTPWPRDDRDGDGLPNDQDIDADGDGLPDFAEGQLTANYLYPAFFDGDDNGIDNAYDFVENNMTHVIDPVNTDGADQPDYLDLNSDNERTSDLAEGHDYDGDGLVDAGAVPLGTDADGDGLDDAFDVIDLDDLLVAAAENPTNGRLVVEDLPNTQNPATVELDWRETDCKQQDCLPLGTQRN